MVQFLLRVQVYLEIVLRMTWMILIQEELLPVSILKKKKNISNNVIAHSIDTFILEELFYPYKLTSE